MCAKRCHVGMCAMPCHVGLTARASPRAVFKEFDTDKSGNIDRFELGGALEKLGKKKTVRCKGSSASAAASCRKLSSSWHHELSEVP